LTKKISEQVFRAQFKEGKLPPLVLWVGEEDYTKFELLAYLRSEAPKLGYNLEVYSAGEDSPSEVLGRAATPSLLGGKTLLVLTEMERCRPSDQRYFMKYTARLPSELNLIAVVSSGMDAEDEFFQSLTQPAAVLEFPLLTGMKLVAWAKEKAKDFGLDIEEKALSRLAAAFEGQLSMLFSEIEKLALLFPPGLKITAEEIEEKLGAAVWEISLKFTDSIKGGRHKEALQSWEEQRLLGVPSEKILSALFYEAANLPGHEENLESLYHADLSLKTGAAPETVLMPLVISRIVHPALRIKEEEMLWLK
jgi:DNA polymerase-3 subunit delta